MKSIQEQHGFKLVGLEHKTPESLKLKMLQESMGDAKLLTDNARYTAQFNSDELVSNAKEMLAGLEAEGVQSYKI